MFGVLLKIVHVILGVFEVLRAAIQLMQKKLYHIASTYVRDKKIIQRDVIMLQKVEKLPNHLTVILGTEEPSYKDLGKLVLWSLLAGISFISFYDSNGILKKNVKKIQGIVDKLKEKQHHIVWHTSQSTEYKNGFSGAKIHVKVYDQTDGRDRIVHEIKHFTNYNLESLNIPTIDKWLNVKYEFPEPDMAVYCGKSLNLSGYPPWHIRITEFFNIDTHHNLHYKEFIDLIYDYSKCERRVGK